MYILAKNIYNSIIIRVHFKGVLNILELLKKLISILFYWHFEIEYISIWRKMCYSENSSQTNYILKSRETIITIILTIFQLLTLYIEYF